MVLRPVLVGNLSTLYSGSQPAERMTGCLERTTEVHATVPNLMLISVFRLPFSLPLPD